MMDGERLEDIKATYQWIVEKGIPYTEHSDIEWLIKQAELAETIAKLREEDSTYYNILLTKLRGQNERYKQALEFYADKKTYETNVTDQWEPVTPIFKDNGKIARKALEGDD